MKKPYIISSAVIIILCVFMFIWPTKYRYDRVTLSNNTFPVRTNRISGRTEYYDISSGWIKQDKGLTTEEAFPEFLPDELKKIVGNAEISLDRKSVFIRIYNGTNSHLNEMTINIKKTNSKNDILWERKYKKNMSIKPLNSGLIMIEVIDLEDVVAWDWTIISAR